MAMPPFILIGGPTASGKTALAVALARHIGGEVINTDSMQLYRGLDILSAQPDEAERAGVPHHLFAVADPSERWSAGRWARAALAIAEPLQKRGVPAVFVGGTGLYFKALIDGIAPAPDIPAGVRADVGALEQSGYAPLRAEAERLDAEGAGRIKPGDRQRLVRLIELVRTTGKPLSVLHADTRPLIAPGSWAGFALRPDREALYARIERRFDAMMAAGALEEARALHARGLDRQLPALKAVGVRPLLAHLDGELHLEEAVERAKTDSRRYAKRQFTWFTNQHADWTRLDAPTHEENFARLRIALEETDTP
ncbi:tRNA delta-isopentenylpyrophosphate transferase [Glycocaulis alkaliphilus]|uniref:tRNA dimethylallyltransferase n=2 Tax=Glycocaulis alkaliphilus TaxID=1434191 RepID=A0A3T0E9E9_9PROT|nr:tRNA delta-isopentenylpyrophosphate transferase [Glycocaulis alkaliphilus]